jgi:phage repressor protein C with HTH and peptisase S24 domain
MQPKYGDHDLIFVDRSDNMFTSEGIYAILYEGTLMVKYLMRIKNGVRIRSLNRELYDDIDFELNEFNSDTVVIVGRVRGAITFN